MITDEIIQDELNQLNPELDGNEDIEDADTQFSDFNSNGEWDRLEKMEKKLEFELHLIEEQGQDLSPEWLKVWRQLVIVHMAKYQIAFPDSNLELNSEIHNNFIID